MDNIYEKYRVQGKPVNPKTGVIRPEPTGLCVRENRRKEWGWI